MPFRQPTLLILGAGASNEVGMPLGSELKKAIADGLQKIETSDFPLPALQAKFGSDFDRDRYSQAAADLARFIGRFVSIDEALHFCSSSREAVLLGRLEIVRNILLYERRSSVFDRKQVGQSAGTWFDHFLSLAMSGLRREEAPRAFETVRVINFNYDRTLEQHLFLNLQFQYGQTEEQAIQAIEGLKIIRPYGTVGRLPWQSGGTTPFGARLSDVDVFELADKIRTYTEGRSSTIYESIQEAIVYSSAVAIVLGFGYHEQNMQLLVPERLRNRALIQRTFCTVRNIPEINQDAIKAKIVTALHASYPTLIMMDNSCEGMLRLAGLTISLEVG